jgi:hypothetical protein
VLAIELRQRLIGRTAVAHLVARLAVDEDAQALPAGRAQVTQLGRVAEEQDLLDLVLLGIDERDVAAR